MSVTMARKPKPKSDRHKTTPFTLRINDRLRAQLEKLAENNVTTFTTEVTIAIRERLERNNMWPPPDESDD